MYKNSKFTIILPAVVACSLVAGVLLGGLVFRTSRPVVRRPALTAPGSDKINRLLSLIGTQYVDSVSIDSLTERVSPLILDELDPHSTYLSAQDLSRAKESIEGEFDGIGVVFNMATDTVIVLNVVNSGPSAKAGIQAGDRIVTVNDTVVAGIKMPQDSVVKRLRGPRGSQVTLGIQRAGVKDLVPFVVTRDAIPIKSIVAAYMIRPETGYIKFEQFSMNAHKELAEAIARLKEQGMKKLILDVRGNGGGYLADMQYTIAPLIDEELLIGYTRAKEGLGRLDYAPWIPSILAPAVHHRKVKAPIVVLADILSVSMAEMTAMAVSALPNGCVVGERTFGGTGPLTSDYTFSYSGQVNNPYMMIYTSTTMLKDVKGVIHEGVGVTPDIEVFYDEAAMEAGTDVQLDRAIEYIQTGR